MATTTPDTSLFDEHESTSELARRVAAGSAGRRYRQVLEILAERPSCLFEVAERLGYFDHQISGRFTELKKLGLIRATGERRVKPATGCRCDVYAIAGDQDQEGGG